MRGRDAVALLVALPWIVWAAVRLFGLERGYLLVAAMAFTPFAAATAWIPVVVALALRRRVVALASLAAAVALVVAVAPRALGDPQEPRPDGRPLTVMSANLRYGRADAGALMRLVRDHDVDVLSLQELTPEAVPRLRAAGLLDRLPQRILDPRAGARGSGILSRHRMLDRRLSPPPGPAMPDAVVQAPGAARLWVKAVHPVKPTFSGMWRWVRDVDGLPEATPSGTLRMLAGDFNATLDHARMRRLLDSGYADAAEVTGDGLHGTYRVLQIDHVLVDRRARVTAVAFHDVPGSDHRAMIVAVSLPGA